jgi:hypothetical protein
MKKLRPQKKTNGKSLETMLSVVSDNVMDNLAFKYLKNVYPIFRTKIDGKFKRTIIVNDTQYSVSQNKRNFIPTIINDISSTFAIEHIDSKLIVFDYFKIKNYQ